MRDARLKATQLALLALLGDRLIVHLQLLEVPSHVVEVNRDARLLRKLDAFDPDVRKPRLHDDQALLIVLLLLARF